MWKVTSQEIQRRTKRAFLRICSNLYTPGEDGLRGTRAAWLRLRKQRDWQHRLKQQQDHVVRPSTS